MVRTRSAAAALAGAGYVRVNGVRIDAASSAVRLGDVITIALDRNVRVLKVLGFTARRGSSDMARVLYVELTQATALGIGTVACEGAILAVGSRSST